MQAFSDLSVGYTMFFSRRWMLCRQQRTAIHACRHRSARHACRETNYNACLPGGKLQSTPAGRKTAKHACQSEPQAIPAGQKTARHACQQLTASHACRHRTTSYAFQHSYFVTQKWHTLCKKVCHFSFHCMDSAKRLIQDVISAGLLIFDADFSTPGSLFQ